MMVSVPLRPPHSALVQLDGERTAPPARCGQHSAEHSGDLRAESRLCEFDFENSAAMPRHGTDESTAAAPRIPFLETQLPPFRTPPGPDPLLVSRSEPECLRLPVAPALLVEKKRGQARLASAFAP